MPRIRRTALAWLAALTAWPAAADPLPADVGTRVADGFAVPALVRFETAATTMAQRMRRLCDDADAAALGQAREGFAGLVGAWGYVSVLRFGPLTSGNRLERVFFWPDPRGVTARQVQALLLDGDEAVLAHGALGGKSVAVQGIPALEFVLHGSDAEALAGGSSGFRCAYGRAIADNVEAIASRLSAEWGDSPFRLAFTAPAPDAEPYRSGKEVAGEIVKALGTALQFTRNAELLPALGPSAAEARGRRAPLWRSRLTFALVGTRLEGLSALLDTAGFGEEPEAASVVAGLAFELRRMREALASLSTPPENAFADATDRERIRYVTVVLEAANFTAGGPLAAALGLTMGFNALDGD